MSISGILCARLGFSKAVFKFEGVNKTSSFEKPVSTLFATSLLATFITTSSHRLPDRT